MEGVVRRPRATSTQERCGAGGGIATEAPVGFPDKVAGGLVAAGAAADVAAERAGNATVEPIYARGCKAAYAGVGRTAIRDAEEGL